MADAGVILDDPQEEAEQPKEIEVSKKAKQFKDYSVKALKKLLDQALAKEDYERAAKIRDEIQRKEGSTE
jgi:protein-arginine kinase activator protein McsA